MNINNTIALCIEQLSYTYSGKKALDQVSFSIQPGECTLLLGPNGAGKSTLFSLITRLYDSRDGQISLCGYDIKRQTRLALTKLGVVFQQSTLDMDLTVMQNLLYHTALHGIARKVALPRIQQELERLNMFPDDHTKLEGASDTKRAFFMGNALVVGVIEKIGVALNQKITNEVALQSER